MFASSEYLLLWDIKHLPGDLIPLIAAFAHLTNLIMYIIDYFLEQVALFSCPVFIWVSTEH